MIIQLSLAGEYIASYDTLVTAREETGIPGTNIKAVINGRRNSAGGCLWEERELPPEDDIPKRRLFFDIETSPNIAFVWQAGYKINISYENIIKERAIICICYKWEGQKSVHFLTWDKKQSDKKMLSEFIKVANTADEMVGHNGDRFDLPWIRARCLFHRIPMFPKYLSVDTLKVFRSKFRLNSNRLNYIGQFLGVGNKIHTDFSLWKDIVLKNDSRALQKMVTYCKEDVRLLERVYEEVKNHIEPKQHYGALYNSNKNSCPECGSENLKVVATRTTPAGTVKDQLLCRGCGKHHYKTRKRKVVG